MMKPERGFVASAGSQIGSRQAGSKVPTGNSRRTGRRAEERPLKSLASGKTVAWEREREREREEERIRVQATARDGHSRLNEQKAKAKPRLASIRRANGRFNYSLHRDTKYSTVCEVANRTRQFARARAVSRRNDNYAGKPFRRRATVTLHV